MFYSNIFKICVLLVLFGIADGKLCNDTRPHKQSSLSFRTVSRNVTYYGICDKEKCLKTRVNTYNQTYIKYVTTEKTILACCKGYRKSGKICKPQCSFICENAVCTEPETCTCKPGYKKLTDSRCVPDCRNCGHGICVAPNFCQCYSNYEQNKNGECVPKCTETCKNAECTGIDTCTCHRGFELALNSTNECVPFCEKFCEHGICVAPNKCKCLDGYKMNANNQCVPVCDICQKGTCIGPNKCVCPYGFTQTNVQIDDKFGVKCEPACEPSCTNGICIDADLCLCHIGFEKNIESTNECTPICNETCINGECISPDKCKCHKDFYRKPNDKYKCLSCSDICQENEPCILPIGCASCPKGYQFNYEHGSCEKYFDSHKVEINCSKDCINGQCSGIDECVCDDGYHSSYTLDWNICDPICDINEDGDCKNGTCIAPYQCICDEGYEMSSTNNYTCILCENCIKIETNCTSDCFIQEESRHQPIDERNNYIYYSYFGVIMALVILLTSLLMVIYRRMRVIQEPILNTPMNLPSIYYTDGPIRNNIYS